MRVMWRGGLKIGVGGKGCLAQSKRDNRSESKMQNPIEIICSHLKSTNCALHCVCATKTQYVCCADTFVDVKNIYMYMFGERDWRQRNSISVNALEQTASLMPNWLWETHVAGFDLFICTSQLGLNFVVSFRHIYLFLLGPTTHTHTYEM